MGIAIVVMDKQEYVQKADSLLEQSMHRPIPWDLEINTKQSWLASSKE